MPQIQLGYSTHKRRTTWNPQIRAVNMLAERTPTNTLTGVDHIQRPGLTLFSTVALPPVQGVFRQAGTFNGDFLVGAGAELYRFTQLGVPTYLGNFDDLSRFVAAATANRAMFTVSGKLYSTAGVTLDDVAMPDDRPAGSVAQLNGYFVIPQQDSARFYWIEPGQVAPDGLSFATTESSPGNIQKVERVGDELWFLKEEGVEVWVPTGDADLPFQRVPGRNYDKGCRAQDSVCRFDNSVVWVGAEGIVWKGEGAPVRISDNSIEEQVRKSNVSDIRAWSFSVDGHELYCLTLTGGTFVYDASTQLWSEFKSYERDYWRAYVGDSGDTFVVAGDSEEGVLYRIDPQSALDRGQPIERVLTGYAPVSGQPVRCDSLQLYVSTGTTPDPNLYPKVRISWSDDLETYGDYEDVSIGRQGQYNEPVEMTRLGAMRYPGRLFKLTVTDNAFATFHGAFVNEPSR